VNIDLILCYALQVQYSTSTYQLQLQFNVACCIYGTSDSQAQSLTFLTVWAHFNAALW